MAYIAVYVILSIYLIVQGVVIWRSPKSVRHDGFNYRLIMRSYLFLGLIKRDQRDGDELSADDIKRYGLYLMGLGALLVVVCLILPLMG